MTTPPDADDTAPGPSAGYRPVPSSVAARDRFRAQRRRDTAPELTLRRLLHARGLRYRVDTALLPGVRRRADVVFTRVRVAVFVDGCFWHCCPVHGTSPKANGSWWRDKLEANVRRDRNTDARLADAGWAVVRVWEHEPPAEAADRVVAAYAARAAQTRRVGAADQRGG